MIRNLSIVAAGAVTATILGAPPASAIRIESATEFIACTRATYMEKVELDGWGQPAKDGDGRYEWYVEHSDGSTWLHVSKDQARNRLRLKAERRGCTMLPLPTRLPGDPAIR